MSNPSNNTPVAVITGAASGVGFELAKLCLKDGMHVVMADSAVNELCDKVEQLSIKADTSVLGVVCNVAHIDQVKQLAKQTYSHFKQVSLVVNTEGIIGHLAPLWELTHEHIRKVLDVNLHGVIHCIQIFMPFLLKQELPSHIVNMASVYGLCNGADMSAYAISQHALVALSESLYFDLKKTNKNVSVSVVCPSYVSAQSATSPSPMFIDRLYQTLNTINQRPRSAEELARQIMQGIKEKTFYIFPDRKVTDACNARHVTMMEHKRPCEHKSECKAGVFEPNSQRLS